MYTLKNLPFWLRKVIHLITYPVTKKTEFTKLFNFFRDEIDRSEVMKKLENQLLWKWQRQVEIMIKHHLQNEREVPWIVNVVGNVGKTYMSNYLSLYHDCFTVDGSHLSTKDFALAYNLQSVVVIDFPRHTSWLAKMQGTWKNNT